MRVSSPGRGKERRWIVPKGESWMPEREDMPSMLRHSAEDTRDAGVASRPGIPGRSTMGPGRG